MGFFWHVKVWNVSCIYLHIVAHNTVSHTSNSLTRTYAVDLVPDVWATNYCVHSWTWGNHYCVRMGIEQLMHAKLWYFFKIAHFMQAKSSSSLWNTGYVPIAEYGSEYLKSRKDQEACKPVRLLYSDGNHYDLLV